MNLKIIMLSKVSQTKTNIWYPLYVESKKYDTNELIYKTESDSHEKQTYGYQSGKAGGRGVVNWGTGIGIDTTLYVKQMINEDLLYNTGNSAQYSVKT